METKAVMEINQVVMVHTVQRLAATTLDDQIITKMAVVTRNLIMVAAIQMAQEAVDSVIVVIEVVDIAMEVVLVFNKLNL